MNKIIITIVMMLMVLPTVLAISPAPNGECYKYEPVLLKTGWNGVSVITDYDTLTTGDIEVELASGFNLEGFSALRNCVPVTSLSFDDYSEVKTYNEAISAGWINPIEVVGMNTTQSTSGKVKNNVCPLEAYWIETDRAMNLTYSGVYGSPVGESINWSEMRISNGTDEKNITDAGAAGWLNSTTLKYWGDSGLGDMDFMNIDATGSFGGKTTLSYSEGVFIKSNLDNIYLLTNNETTPCKVKLSCRGNFVGNGKCKLKPLAKTTPSGKFSFKIWLNHAIRLLGSERDTIG